MSFVQDNTAFEAWLHTQCDVYKPDLAYKHRRMQRDAFAFLRATFFRWAKGIEAICPDLSGTTPVLSVGDTHLENFGTWRDDEGRLVWGVNDFDEAAIIPYAFDLVRLATSARLARGAKDAKAGNLAPFMRLSNRDTAALLLEGYKEGLEAPRPTLLDENETWLRPFVACSDKQRDKFWSGLAALKARTLENRVLAGFKQKLPEGAAILRTARRPRQGSGSLGRPRFIAIAAWRGGRIVREAKALVPSAWGWAHGEAASALQFETLSKGPHRSPDPWLHVHDRFIFRRLAADARKVALARHTDTDAPESDETNSRKLIRAMGFDIGAIHAGSDRQVKAIARDLDKRDPPWLQQAAKAAANWVKEDYEEWCRRG